MARLDLMGRKQGGGSRACHVGFPEDERGREQMERGLCDTPWVKLTKAVLRTDSVHKK